MVRVKLTADQAMRLTKRSGSLSRASHYLPFLDLPIPRVNGDICEAHVPVIDPDLPTRHHRIRSLMDRAEDLRPIIKGGMMKTLRFTFRATLCWLMFSLLSIAAAQEASGPRQEGNAAAGAKLSTDRHSSAHLLLVVGVWRPPPKSSRSANVFLALWP